MVWAAAVTEISDRFASNRNDPRLSAANCPSLTAIAKEQLAADLGDDQLIAKFLFAVCKLYLASPTSVEESALIRGGLAYLLCGYLPNDHDLFLIRTVNPALKGSQTNTKQVRDAWAFMNYKRALQRNPNIGYTAKSGRTKRVAFRDAILRAVNFSMTDLARLREGLAKIPADEISGGAATGLVASDRRELVDSSEIISETVPDGTIFPFGATFTKSWTLRNSGEVPWINRTIRRMTPNTPTYPHSAETVRLADTMPGESVVISLEMTVNRYPSIAIVRFKMVDERGNLCWPNSYPLGLSVAVESRGLHWRKEQ
ncbi:NBR1-Ig-like domain-containing protein [Psychromicrobium lacuslunae]|uniref:NBR1-Ig-like domain-containing protein n=1 Tax=Psychromicrobium lacuslunae TaxID=1618207 RepID=UPI000698B46A|nr:NBR1-Ig-like domain-containing protein [Psychromicrobium lacuslunae]